jgi:hypothetical protein
MEVGVNRITEWFGRGERRMRVGWKGDDSESSFSSELFTGHISWNIVLNQTGITLN